VSLDDLVTPFRAIAKASLSVDGLPTISAWLRSRLGDAHLRDIAPMQSVAPLAERMHAEGILTTLAAASSEPTALCHGDAHPGNVLVSADRPRVLLIDPRGMCGEVEYDLGVLALKVASYDHKAARTLARQLAARVGVDGERAAAWTMVAGAARV
jgi:streptomycin 6-kinase